MLQESDATLIAKAGGSQGSLVPSKNSQLAPETGQPSWMDLVRKIYDADRLG